MVNDYLMNMFFKGGDMGARLKSIQYGVVDLGLGVTSNTAEIDSVDVANSLVVWLGELSTGADAKDYQHVLTLTNPTTVTATRLYASAGESSCSFMVISFLTGIKSIQLIDDANIPSAATVTDHTIAEIVPTKSCLFKRGILTGSGSTFSQAHLHRATILDSTTVRFTTRTNVINHGPRYTVLEFE